MPAFIIRPTRYAPGIACAAAGCCTRSAARTTCRIANAARAMESKLFCIGALWSPETGIIDSHTFMRALWGELENRGGMIAFATPVERLSFKAPHWRVQFGGREPCTLEFDAVVNAAGLGTQALARRIEGYPTDQVPRLVLGKGNYFGYAGRPVFSRLIYPTPI